MSGEGKLVRGRVPERVGRRGTQPYFRVARDRDEHLRLACQKAVDEVGEAVVAALTAPDTVLEEVADAVEAIVALALLNGFTVRDVVAAVRDKRGSHGDFAAGMVLSWRDTCQ